MANKITPELRINQKYKAPVGAAVTTTTASGIMTEHALYGPLHTGTLDRTQAPWVASDISAAIASHSGDLAGHTAFNWLALNSYNALWTTSSWRKSLTLPGPAYAIQWPKGVTATAWGIGATSGNFYIASSTADDNSAAVTYPLTLTGAGAITLNAATGQSISHQVNGSDIAVTNVDRIMPGGSILKDLGDYNRKWRTLYAAELYVETLVAQSVMATIGGRVMVAPTAKLIADVNSSQTTIDTDYSSFLANDYIYFSSAPGGVAQVEVMKVSGTPTTITGGYRYTVSRNLDGSGANSWVAGDAGVSLGNSTSKGYIDLSSTSTIHGHIGPTIAIYSRSATTNWNDVKPVVTMGNLRSFVDYGADNMGFATGNDLTLTPTTGFKGVTIDRSNGLRMFNVDISLYNSGTLKTRIYNSGMVQFGSTSGARIEWDGVSKLRGLDSSAAEQWYADSTTGVLNAGGGECFLDADGLGINAEAWSVVYPSSPATTKSVRWMSDVGVNAKISGDYSSAQGGSNRFGAIQFQALKLNSGGSVTATTAMRLESLNNRLELDADFYMTGDIKSPTAISTGTSLPLELITSSSGPYSLALTRSDLSFATRLFNDGAGMYFEHAPRVPHLRLVDGITAPSTVAGLAQIYVDSADGDLKVKFGDGTVKTIVVDT